jgi:hypothetical protein
MSALALPQATPSQPTRSCLALAAPGGSRILFPYRRFGLRGRGIMFVMGEGRMEINPDSRAAVA